MDRYYIYANNTNALERLSSLMDIIVMAVQIAGDNRGTGAPTVVHLNGFLSSWTDAT